MTGVSYRQLQIFRPYADENTWELIGEIGDGLGFSAAQTDSLITASKVEPYTRIGKIGDEVVALYLIRDLGQTRFELEIIGVRGGFRRKGLGGWMLGHALGLAESKGGRQLHVSCSNAGEFFTRIGFEPDGAGLRLDFQPE